MIVLKICIGIIILLYSISCFMSIKSYIDEKKFNKITRGEFGLECENTSFESAYIASLFEIAFLIIYLIILIKV